ncbi:MAG: iron-sulfur cluster assembly scaffold protein [Candidatus ainarchaeum sp.]|nr:iron-sulfur cluster assembly scaffold protein [Candidatus ainarchaeum sp.]MDD3975680.1 iron-sulfur cluster assembly scaffold protein [Candidatus ainarchaeum sp.]
MQNIKYSKKVKEHFLHPHNMGKIKNADGIGKLGNPACGDVMYIYLKIIKKNEKEIIKDIKFQTMGCAAAISTSSMITDIVKGKTLEEAFKITNKDVAKELDGLPPIKMHCSNLAADVLKEAIKDYYNKQKNRKIKYEKTACYKCCDSKKEMD